MKKISAADFKARCLTLMDEVSESREPVLITKRGRPVAKLVPLKRTRSKLIGRLQGIVKITGDIESPLEPPEAWDALR